MRQSTFVLFAAAAHEQRHCFGGHPLLVGASRVAFGLSQCGPSENGAKLVRRCAVLCGDGRTGLAEAVSGAVLEAGVVRLRHRSSRPQTSRRLPTSCLIPRATLIGIRCSSRSRRPKASFSGSPSCPLRLRKGHYPKLGGWLASHLRPATGAAFEPSRRSLPVLGMSDRLVARTTLEVYAICWSARALNNSRMLAPWNTVN